MRCFITKNSVKNNFNYFILFLFIAVLKKIRVWGNKNRIFCFVFFNILLIGNIIAKENKNNYKSISNEEKYPLYNQKSIKNIDLKHIKNYKVFIRSIKNLKGFVTLRKFTNQKNENYYLVLNTYNLNTYIVHQQRIESYLTTYDQGDAYRQKRISYLKTHNNHWSGLGSVKSTGYVLSLDLCPSSKPFDKDFFDFLTANKLAPLYIAISGKWIKKHLKELKYIIDKKGNDIIWVNHSYNHHYDSKISNNKNFMLMPNTHLNFEILNNEKLMLENGLIPSPFFRFPGLIANEKLYNKILSYGLIPLGSNAWLAKGQRVNQGSIILLHMNGNERIGLKLFNSFFKKTDLKVSKIIL